MADFVTAYVDYCSTACILLSSSLTVRLLVI